MQKAPDLSVVESMDANDPLRSIRDRFALPKGVIYLDGNSLGPASYAALAELQASATEEWAEDLIRSWNKAGWFDLPTELGDKVGRLIGAAAGQTVICDNTSINIYKALHSALALREGRNVIVAEANSFPTDLYVAEGVVSTRKRTVLRLGALDLGNIDALLDERTAVVLINHVDFRTGALRDMEALTRKVHAAGAIVVWDLCHSAGALPVDLDRNDVDFAVGCTYKYLNGGPGAPAFIYAAKRHLGNVEQPVSGWWGHARPFDFEPSYSADSGIRRFLSGTQPILSFRALKGALSVWDGVEMEQVREKSISLTKLFVRLVEERCSVYGLELDGPREAARRGSQISFLHPHGYQVMQALIERGVIGDFRPPSTMRFGFTPLYTRYRDVWQAVDILEDVLRTGIWKEKRFSGKAVVT